MIKQIFSVCDNKSGVFSNPFTSVNQDTAIRDFAYEVNQGKSEINRYPEDFALYYLGSFDDMTGNVVHDGIEILCHANQVKTQL